MAKREISIGNKPISPVTEKISNQHVDAAIEHLGISYRMWLIGQALAGLPALKFGDEIFHEGSAARAAIDIADRIIEILDEETVASEKQRAAHNG